jgi:hypothetical protein
MVVQSMSDRIVHRMALLHANNASSSVMCGFIVKCQFSNWMYSYCWLFYNWFLERWPEVHQGDNIVERAVSYIVFYMQLSKRVSLSSLSMGFVQLMKYPTFVESGLKVAMK